MFLYKNYRCKLFDYPKLNDNFTAYNTKIPCLAANLQKYMFSKCLLRHDVVRVFVSTVPCVSFCPGHFVMVPLNMTYLHSLFEHLLNLYCSHISMPLACLWTSILTTLFNVRYTLTTAWWASWLLHTLLVVKTTQHSVKSTKAYAQNAWPLWFDVLFESACAFLNVVLESKSFK